MNYWSAFLGIKLLTVKATSRLGNVVKSQSLRHGAEGTVVEETDARVERPQAAQGVAEGGVGLEEVSIELQISHNAAS